MSVAPVLRSYKSPRDRGKGRKNHRRRVHPDVAPGKKGFIACPLMAYELKNSSISPSPLSEIATLMLTCIFQRLHRQEGSSLRDRRN